MANFGHWSVLLILALNLASGEPVIDSFSTLNEECRNCTDWCLASYDHSYLPETTSYYAEASPSEYGHRHTMAMDTASLTIVSKCALNLTVQIRSSECFNCSFTTLTQIPKFSRTTVTVDTKYAMEFHVLKPLVPNAQLACNDYAKFSQYGNYTYHISPNTSMGDVVGYVCVFGSGDPADDVNIPVWVMLCVIFVLFVLFLLLEFLDRRYALYARITLRRTRFISTDLGMPQSRSVSTNELNRQSESQDNSPANHISAPVKTRLKSLDTFRGISITLMIFVNYGGGGYWYFKHAPWNGLNLADLVFPWFIFIMGTSMVFSFQNQIHRNIHWTSILYKIIKRSIILILLGLILNSAPRCPHKETKLENFRIPGVLQRIGVTYLMTSLIHLMFVHKQESRRIFYVAEWVVQLSLVCVHLGLTFLLPVPGCPTGYLGPGGMADLGNHENCTGGAAGYIDRAVFGSEHMYQHPTSHRVYGGTMAYDPEGILGCLTSIFLCFLGLQAGRIFHRPCWKTITVQLLLFCLASTSFGILLCEATKETGWIPINKNLWSLSYVLCMAGTSYMLLAVCYIVIDHYRMWSGAPFLFAGMNPILMYIGHEIFHYYLPVSFHVADDHWSQLAMDCWGTVFWLIVVYVLHRKKIYLSI